MDDEWVLNCLRGELLLDGKCVPFEQVEEEVKALLAKGLEGRSHADNIRLALLYQALKDYMRTLNELERQFLENQQSFIWRYIPSWRPW
jgi:hypothetical protein